MKLNVDIVFQYIYFVTRLYVPSIPNQKKIKQLMECIPFFLPQDQQLFFQIIKENSIVNYYDTTDQMVTYGYILYETYHLRKKITYLDMDKYVKHYDYILFMSQNEKDARHQKYVSFIIFICIVLICLYFIYAS
jgi:hypothetical protein